MDNRYDVLAPRIVSTIRWQAAALAREHALPGWSVDDYEQALTEAVLRKAGQYDPGRAGFATFAARVIESRARDLRREGRVRAQERDAVALDGPAGAGGPADHLSPAEARCPAHQDRSPSLSIGIGADARPLVRCHAGCEQADVIDALRRRGLWPVRAEGGDPDRAAPRSREREPVQHNGERAIAIWQAAVPSIIGTPAEIYLRGRGLDPARLLTDPPGWPETLRWSTDADGRGHAALVVAVNDAGTGLVAAVHRIFLHADGNPVRDRDGGKLKRSLGPIRGNAARLSAWPSADGRWGLAEGVETALAARQLLGIPTWAAISAGNMANVCPPSWARHVVVVADHDARGLAEAARAAALFRREPSIESVRVVRASEPRRDAADLLRGNADAG